MLWNMNNVDFVGGHRTVVIGKPKLITGPSGPAIEFDGTGDALFLSVHPLAGFATFTLEVTFRPDPNGLDEQRFFHLQEHGTDHRILFETRLTSEGRWFLDTYVHSAAGSCALFAEEFQHPVGSWYHAALVVNGQTMRHYVNSELELEAELSYEPQTSGQTSIGCRINQVCWFKGALSQIRTSADIRSPADFLQV